MRYWIVAVAAAIGAVQLSSAVQAQELSLLYRILGSETETRCWGRDYDARHLERQAKQRVVSIRIDAIPRPPADRLVASKNATALERYQAVKDIWIAIRLRAPSERASKVLVCSASRDNNRLTCGLESDGGTVTITPLDNGRLRFAAGDRMQFETERGFVDLTKSDDRVFDLALMPARQCRAPNS